jgi:hypothetical protein
MVPRLGLTSRNGGVGLKTCRRRYAQIERLPPSPFEKGPTAVKAMRKTARGYGPVRTCTIENRRLPSAAGRVAL